MKLAREIVLPVVAFIGAMSMSWGLRMASSPQPDTVRRNVIPAGVQTADDSSTGGIEGTPELTLSELRSVTSGLVVLPLDATPETVTAAFAGAWKRLKSDPGADMKLQAQQLFSDWLRVDPEAAIRFVREPPGLLKERGGEFLLAALAETDPERACQIAFKSGLDSQTASGEVLKVWASRDPAAALAYVSTLPSHQRLAAEMSALTGWAAVSGPEAFAWLQSQPEGWRRDRLMNKMAVCLLQNSPGDMVNLMKLGGLPPEMMKGLRQWEEKTDSAQILSAAQAALTAGGDVKDLLRLFGTNTSLSFLVLAGGGGLNDLENRLRQAQKTNVSRLGAALMVAAVQNAAPKDVADVAKLAASFDSSDVSLLLRGLGRAAPEAGLAWAVENNQPLTALAASWADYDARAALQSLLALPRGEASDAAVREIIAKAAQTAPAEAIEAVLQVTMPADERRKHLSAAARVLARSDPAQAVQALGRIPDAPPEEVSAVLAISGRSDAKAAAAALATCELATNGYIAAESLTRGWAIADPSGASEWVRTLPPGELRDGGAAGLARSVMESDPSAAFTWAMEINDGTIRDNVALQAVAEIKKTQSLEQIEADARISDAARGVLQTYWNRPDTPPVSDPHDSFLRLFPIR